MADVDMPDWLNKYFGGNARGDYERDHVVIAVAAEQVDALRRIADALEKIEQKLGGADVVDRIAAVADHFITNLDGVLARRR